MIPKIDKYDFFLYSDFRNGDNPHNLIQLIAHSEDFLEDNSLTENEKELFSKRKEFCEMIFEDEWSLRSGIVQFFFEFPEKKFVENYYKKFIQYAKEFNFDSEIPNLKKTLEFYIKHETEIRNLEKNQDNDDWWEKVQNLETKYTYYYSTVEKLANLIIQNPNDYCRDENGDLIDPNFTGRLKHYLKKGTLRYEYSVVNGQILGEFIEYHNDGNKRELSNRDGYFNRDSIKRWFPSGQIEFEKINDSDCRYWYKNGQMEMERIGDVIMKWDENGQKIK